MAQATATQGNDQEEPVSSRTAGGICRIVLSNPPANALSIAVMKAVRDALDEADQDPSVRVIVLSAAGNLFSAGHDLKEMTAHRNDPDRGRGFFEHTFAMCSGLMRSVVEHAKPVIAEVDGIATAAGCQLVASCDLAVASERARFGVNGIDVGLFCSTPAVALARKVHRKHAMEMLLTGEMIDAATALRYGLVNRVVAPDELNRTVDELARTIATKSPSAIGLGKKIFREQVEMNLASAYDHASRAMVDNMLTGDAEEGILAFFDKRKPEWNRH